MGYSPWGRKVSGTTERLTLMFPRQALNQPKGLDIDALTSQWPRA